MKYLVLLALSSFLCTGTFAEKVNLNLPARLLASGTTGTTTGFNGDFMWPLYTNQRGFIYTNAQSKYMRDQSWFTGISAGTRQVLNAQHVLGAYLFFDTNTTKNKKNYWSINPGIEGIYSHWDWHVNGYLPANKRHSALKSAWADELGDVRYVKFSGHKQFDHLFVDTEIAGKGVDAELGYLFSENQLRLALGGYYFDFHDLGHMNGIIGTVEYPLNQRITLLLQDSYDNVRRNTCMFSVRLRFGEIPSTRGIETRLLEPIRRNLATIDNGTSIPNERGWLDNGQSLVEKDHLWFFKPGGERYLVTKELENCTAEHPCDNTQLTQAVVDNISALDPTSDLYLASGIYVLDPGASERISMNPGQAIEGREDGYLLPALEDKFKPLLIGGLDMNGDNLLADVAIDKSVDENLFRSFTAEFSPSNVPQSSQTVALTIRRNNHIIREITIGRPNDSNGYITGISVAGAREAGIAFTRIFVGNNNVRKLTGVEVTRMGSVDIDGSFITVRANSDPNSAAQTIATGVEVNSNSTLWFLRSELDIGGNFANQSSLASDVTAQGIWVKDFSRSIVNRSAFFIKATNANRQLGLNASATAIGINNATNPGLINPAVSAVDNNFGERGGFNVESIASFGVASAWGILQPVNASSIVQRNNRFNVRRTGTRQVGQNVGP